jgi:2-oxoisovalerate dehydrogenase E1 component
MSWELADLLSLHQRMLRIRRFEEKASELYRNGEIPGFLHLSDGQEAVAVGTCWPLRPTDGIVSTHRGHGHCLAKGVDMTAMFAELMGRATGICKGLGGSMHIADIGVGVYGANGIVAGGLPIAVGIASAFRQLQRDDVVVALFGEGAVAQGAFHEALNLAAVWKLPILFMCENNQFAEFSRLSVQHPVTPSERAAAYGLEGQQVDGNDVVAIADATSRVIAELRNGSGPRFIEAITFRVRGHYEGDPGRYRDDAESMAWKARDPLLLSAARIGKSEESNALVAIDQIVGEEVLEAVSRAQSAPSPEPGAHLRSVFSDAIPQLEGRLSATSGQFRYMDALRDALAMEMQNDSTVWLAGIDIGATGGPFGITRGLAERFPGRVHDTPISETAIIGLAVGGAMAGTKPVVELMYLDFLGVCMDQILNQAAKMHFMTGSAATMSLVIRTQFGAGRSSGPQHSQSLESILTQIPGLIVVMPSDPADAYGLLRAAIANPNPVIFIENRLLYGKRGPKPPPDHFVPLCRGRIVRRGRHLTIVSWSRMVDEVMAAVERVATEGIDVEVIDLRTVAPFDRELVAESIQRTHRVLIAHEAPTSTGVGAEIAAWVADKLFWSLDAPVSRVAPPFTPVPYSKELEAEWLPDVVRIAEAIRATARV